MALIRKKKSKETPPVSTASLPDIVFMLLFFFMVTTTMREVTLLVRLKKPKATEMQKLDRKDLTTYVYMGAPKTRSFMARNLGFSSTINWVISVIFNLL